METKFVTVHVKNSQFKMQLIQFIVDKNGSIRVICMDEVGNFHDFAINEIQGKGFEI